MINNYPIVNVYEKNSSKSKLSSQLIYGEKFQILKKKKDWLKIRTSYDKYTGFIKKKSFLKSIKIKHKVSSLSAKLYSKPKGKFLIRTKLPFCSKISVTEIKNNFYKFGNYWIEKNNIVPINYKQQIFKDIKMFRNIPYKWGGKTYKGIDCSALVQLFYKFNNLYCPRDTKDQINYFKKTKSIKKNAIIFWKGHVAICLSNTRLIHAYGPKKKVVLMNIKKTIKLIEKTAKLKVIGIR